MVWFTRTGEGIILPDEDKSLILYASCQRSNFKLSKIIDSQEWKTLNYNDKCLLFNFCSADLEWKIIYVGSAESEEYDQVLDSVLVGPVPAGRHMFVFQVSLN